MSPCTLRAPHRSIWPISAAAAGLLFLMTAGLCPAAEPRADAATVPLLFPDDQPQGVPAGAVEVVRRFDFDERGLGNYEDTPLHWERLEGPGLPRYSGARLDDECGHLAPPSFRFDVQGGSVAYEYAGSDLLLIPGAEHYLVGYVRAVGLREARAFVQVSLLDAAGGVIPGSDRISDLLASTRCGGDGDTGASPDSGAAAEPWQRIEVHLPTDIPAAAAVRLTLWVLQAYAWRETPEGDPIVRQDVDARVWFDDLTLYRLPRVRLKLSTGSTLIRREVPASFVIEVRNPTPVALQFDLSLSDAFGQVLHERRGAIPANASSPLEHPVPPLEPGTYTAQLFLRDESESFGNRSLRFAVLEELPQANPGAADFGIDLGELEPGDADGLVQLVSELGCRAAKLGLTLPDDDISDPSVEAARDLVRRLLSLDVQPTGVILPPRLGPSASSTRMALMTPDRSSRLAPLLLPMGNAVSSWQLGAERTEIDYGSAWDAAALHEVRRDIQTFVTFPQIVVPKSVFGLATDQGAPGTEQRPRLETPDVASIYVPPHAPTRNLPAQLAQWQSADAPWIMLETDDALPVETRIVECTRRLTLAKAAGAERVFLPAPFGCDPAIGRWCPNELYVPLRTLCRFLAGKHATAVLPATAEDTLAILFIDGQEAGCVVAWSWCDQAGPPLAICGCEGAEVWDLWGRRRPGGSGDQILVPLEPAPVIIAPVNAAAVALQANLAIDPNLIDTDAPDVRPVLRMANPFAAEMAGVLTLKVPPYWCAAGAELALQLAPGQSLEHELDLALPPREMAGEKLIGVQLELSLPRPMTLSVSIPVRLGLSGASFEAVAQWRGSDLVVEQVVRNTGRTTLDAVCSCQAAGRCRLEGALLGIAPEQTVTQVFEILDARELAGSSLLVGLEKANGRRLETVVAVPP